MTGPDILARIDALLPGAVTSRRAEGNDPFAGTSPERLRELMALLRDDPELCFDILNSVTAVDYLEPNPKKQPKAGFEPHLEVVYHLSSFRHRHRFAVKVTLPRWAGGVEGALPEVPSVADLWPAADWHEREAFDLLGVRFTGHPNLERILMAEDWEGHPLRKDYVFPLEYQGIRCR